MPSVVDLDELLFRLLVGLGEGAGGFPLPEDGNQRIARPNKAH
jgi:hypothetical protein